MNGPEHYREAEKDIEHANRADDTAAPYYIARAQVHATLALAAKDEDPDPNAWRELQELRAAVLEALPFAAPQAAGREAFARLRARVGAP